MPIYFTIANVLFKPKSFFSFQRTFKATEVTATNGAQLKEGEECSVTLKQKQYLGKLAAKGTV